jgi:hypothetical protein
MRALLSTNVYYCYPEAILSCPLSNRKSSELVTDPCTENLELGPTKGVARTLSSYGRKTKFGMSRVCF